MWQHACYLRGIRFCWFWPLFQKNLETNNAQNALQQEWGNFPFANWNGIFRRLPLQLVQLIKIHSLPHLESFMWEPKFEKNFFKKNCIQTPNGLLLIFKLPFKNGGLQMESTPLGAGKEVFLIFFPNFCSYIKDSKWGRKCDFVNCIYKL